ncbi:hypothetical protein BZ163_32795 [Pseudomonas sp. VI4.1]|nr:hypothetical protein BZ163_32795 [Pseudomonas sp. VI4.1]
MLAMDVNDDAGCLEKRVAFKFIVGTPPGTSSLLHDATCASICCLNATRNPAQSPRKSPTPPSGCARTP